jgi:hypothetical protein
MLGDSVLQPIRKWTSGTEQMITSKLHMHEAVRTEP